MNDAIIEPNKVKRPYRRVTKSEAARFAAERAIKGNGTSAVETLTPDYKHPKDRATKLSKKLEDVGVSEYMDNRLDEIAVKAIDRLDELVSSTDEAIATRNVHFALEQKRGKAVQKTQSENVNINIETVLA